MAIATTVVHLNPLLAGDCGRFPAPGFDGPDSRKYSGRYSDPLWAFETVIPKGLTGHGTPDPAPHHGFGIVLSWEPRAYVAVYAFYNSLDETLGQTRETAIQWLREDAKRLTRVEYKRCKLGTADALGYVAFYTCPAVPGNFVAEKIIAFHDGIIYTVELLTTKERHTADRLVLENLLMEWRWRRPE